MPRRRDRKGGSAGGPTGQGGLRSLPLWGLRITPAGAGFVGVNVLVVVAALSSEANLLLLVSCLSAGVLVASAVWPVVMVRRIEAERICPQAVVAGRPFSLAYVVRCRRRWGDGWSLVVGETPGGPTVADLPRGFVARLAAGREQRLELLACCARRGRVKLSGIRVGSRFPFGLFSCTVDLDRPAELVVYPPVGRLRADLTRDRGGATGAAVRGRRHHEGDEEFVGVREFREGDNYRWIHWRRSARTGELVVRESLPHQAVQLVILVDPWPERAPATGRPGDRASRGLWGRAARLEVEVAAERAISAAATAACDALERGHRVGLMARAKVPVVVAPAGGRTHRSRLLRELALLMPDGQDALDVMVARMRWTAGWHARCLICTARLTESHRRVMRFLGRRAESVLAAVPGTEWFENTFGAVPQRAGKRSA